MNTRIELRGIEDHIQRKANTKKEDAQMTFDEAEVVNMGLAEDLIQELVALKNTEGIPDGFPPADWAEAVYTADDE